MAKPKKADPAKPTLMAKPKMRFSHRARQLLATGKTVDEAWEIMRTEYDYPDVNGKGFIRDALWRGKWREVDGVQYATTYKATVVWFLKNCPDVVAVVNADEPPFVVELLARATGRTVEKTVENLRAALPKKAKAKAAIT